MALAEQLVLDLINPALRERALCDLSKFVCRKVHGDEDQQSTTTYITFERREIFQDLAPILWSSFGSICVLLQCLALHPDTRTFFLNANLPVYLYPFLLTKYNTTPFDHLRLTSLGVIGTLVKVEDTEVIKFLISTEIVPLCLRSMDFGSELSQTVATFIFQKVLLDDTGLQYVCDTPKRFFCVSNMLRTMLAKLTGNTCGRLLKLIIGCYLRLSDNARARVALRDELPNTLKDATFSSYFREDRKLLPLLQQLVYNVTGDQVAALQAGLVCVPRN
eukprot:TRINITY_DN13352_c0_g1_i2.p1 TRINITY_DN13352_c0_g1~~TRINITY_DN13352_c0_g1_i2.p1  ORF type:complete len:322 (-),score=28.12 TRINITY_DN13352_c0_g1_i2:180-1007(-)